ncbi:N-acetylglucosamine repressor [Bacteroidia bacterium]|nr:N-acetylglucosamine repressor [Bacteroidia bacterium]
MKASKKRLDDKAKNLNSILRIIQKYGPVERKQIQELTQLSWGAVSQYTNALLRGGVLTQSLTTESSTGKPPLLLEINNDDNFIIGVDFNFNFIRVMALDLKGSVVKSYITTVTDASRIIQLLITSLEDVIGQLEGKNILTISISVQGNIDEEQGVALYLSFVPAWRNLKLKEVVENHFGIHTFTFHDPDCIMIAERYFDSIIQDTYANVIVLNMNMGIGMSLMTHGKLYTTSFGCNGELGHINVVEDGAFCSCGKKGCLEAYSSKVGIINRFVEAVNNDRKTVLDKDQVFSITYETIRDGAVSGDALCVELFREAGYYLGKALATVSTLLNPDVIILYGLFANDHDLYGEVTEQAFRDNVYANNNTLLCYSSLTGTAPVLGAAMYAQEKIIKSFLLERTNDFDNSDTENEKSDL